MVNVGPRLCAAPALALFASCSRRVALQTTTSISIASILGTTKTTSRRLSSSTMVNLSPLLDAHGATVAEPTDTIFRDQRVALYFAAGWCPMCTSFEPSLKAFTEAAAAAQTPIQLVYVPSDRSAEDAAARAASLGLWTVPYEQADAYKTKYRIWAGSESAKLGTDRRSGVPALVVLDQTGTEMAFVAAEADGPKALETWPMDNANGVWGSSK